MTACSHVCHHPVYNLLFNLSRVNRAREHATPCGWGWGVVQGGGEASIKQNNIGGYVLKSHAPVHSRLGPPGVIRAAAAAAAAAFEFPRNTRATLPHEPECAPKSTHIIYTCVRRRACAASVYCAMLKPVMHDCSACVFVCVRANDEIN